MGSSIKPRAMAPMISRGVCAAEGRLLGSVGIPASSRCTGSIAAEVVSTGGRGSGAAVPFAVAVVAG